ncbi:MAG: M50 family metallopeptidase [Saprospiraceae bacterium]
MKNNTLLRILIVLLLYLGLKFFGGAYGQMILYPITLLVTFLHEFGHALGALITGGEVLSVQINPNGSGMTTTRGGFRSIILMGGYIGSAILGNILFYMGSKQGKVSQIGLNVLAVLMIVVGFIWFDGLYTTGFLMVFALALFFIANRTSLDREAMMFLGLACLFHIVQDFRVGPSSDLEMYAELFVFIPKTVWMYIWLAIVVILCIFNLKYILSSAVKERNQVV